MSTRFPFANLTVPGVYVVGDELGDEVVLGRNVLNRLRLLLDGPALATVLLDERVGLPSGL